MWHQYSLTHVCLDLLSFTWCVRLPLHTLKCAARGAKSATEHRCVLTQFDLVRKERCSRDQKHQKWKGMWSPAPSSPPVCHFKRAGASPKHLKAGQRPLTALHREPAEVKASEARGCICLDLAHWRCKVCDPSTLRVLICLRKAPGRLQICKNITAAGRLRVPSSHSYLMAPLLKASFASCGVFIFTSRVPVLTYKCCCHFVQLFTECPYWSGPGSRGPEGAVIIVLLLLSWRERRENDLFSIWSCQYEPVRLLWYFAEINGRPATMMPQTANSVNVSVTKAPQAQSEPCCKLFLKLGFPFKA